MPTVPTCATTGSSPLARGLPHSRPVRQCVLRIIPARAGFTRRPGHRRCGAADHPRSRGVYSTRRSGRKWRAGSSPLARGLRRLRPQGAPPSRIIPARAGFTASLTAYRARPGDHPRSRGVYARSATISSRSTGSSPLARGLREAERAPLAPRRIIPARAGFTARPSSSGLTSRDHPRSRGVYSGSEGGGSFSGGSSPLARGLHPARQDILEHRRIIPARAGFTGTGVPATAAYRDHPRSRGVYLAGMSTTHVDEGSSPLARGLLTPKGIDVEKERIIPARAGFTVRSPAPRAHSSDHPRSRGVYRFQAAWAAWAAGSSPLARGLLGVGIVLLKPVRIIPARAGFTRRQRRRHPTRRDHPRSRGVYLTRNELIKMLNGSSPLARGLQHLVRGLRIRPGIIPARAGFTGRAGAPRRPERDHPRSRGVYASSAAICSRARWIIPARAGFTSIRVINGPREGDHPRSRGVYQWRPRAMAVWRGSSPLARGLHRGPVVGDDGDRIIPARAGFTRSWTCPTPAGADHPRSRGVYDLLAPAVSFLAGSSPLARGLRSARPPRGLTPRIIPARAGFTGSRRPGRPGRPDHPRSRGVYSAWG